MPRDSHDEELEALVQAVTDPLVSELRGTIGRLQKRLDKERNRTEALTAAMYEAVHDGLAAVTVPDFTPPVKDNRTKGEEIAVLFASDYQLGKRTPTYNSEVCEERVREYCARVAKLVDIQRLDHPVKRAAIFVLGDIVEGELIFPGQSHLIDTSLYRQVTIDGPRILGGLVRWAASFFEQVDVYAVPGNHGHLGGRARKEMHPESNADRMLYQIVSQLTEDLSNVKWHISEDWWLTADLGEGSKFLLLHGDQVRGYNGIPWYGWMRKVMAWSTLARIWPDMQFDHVAAGHFHTPVSLYLNSRRVWINASTESHNPYALEQLAAAGEPAQWLLFSRPGRGVTAEYLVNLEG